MGDGSNPGMGKGIGSGADWKCLVKGMGYSSAVLPVVRGAWM